MGKFRGILDPALFRGELFGMGEADGLIDELVCGMCARDVGMPCPIINDA